MAIERPAHLVIVDVSLKEFEDGHERNSFTMRLEGDRDYLADAKAVIEALGRNQERRCADGSLTHDFKGQSSCPACGWWPKIKERG